MTLEKVYDELIGMIEDLKKKVAGISGGSVVTITPTLESGEKVADFSVDGTEGAIFAPQVLHIYSTTEQLIGKWIDGTDLFGKTIEIGALPNASSKNIAHGITDLSKVISIDGYAYTGTSFAPLPFISTTASNCVVVSVTTENIIIETGSNRSGWSGYITLLYTKSTENRKTTKKK